MPAKKPIIDGKKECALCDEWKVVIEFKRANGKYLYPYCKACQTKKATGWRAKNPARYKAIQKRCSKKQSKKNVVRAAAWAKKNPGRAKQIRIRNAAKNRIEVNRKSRERYRIKNEIDPDGEREKRRIARLNNLQSRRDSNRRWSKKNKGKENAKVHRHRSKNRGREGSFTTQEWDWLVQMCGNKCLCPCSLCDDSITKDHIDPNGSNYIENLQPLCLPCNSAKQDKFIKDFRPKWLVDNFPLYKFFAGL